MTNHSDIDSIDTSLLKLLQKDGYCVPKTTKLAKELNLPAATVHSRIKKLVDKGVIQTFQAVLDGKKAGKSLIVFTILKVVYSDRYSDKKSMLDFAKKLTDIPEVMEVHSCSADWDYFLKMKVKDTTDYNRVLTEELLPLGGIEKSESVVVYGTYKENLNISLP
jgi:Lrp/AsnC family leucine-responsive transcriptional regulator